MNHLAIDTSTNICSVSLYCNSKYKTMKKEDISDHSEYLPIFVNKLKTSLKRKPKKEWGDAYEIGRIALIALIG